ncbi:MAG: dienelactone hydrolase family protein [Ignavibacteria bacterium]|nr:dienelactone hydrolase family protein [Ignavibacteria bacterium]
MTRHEQTGTFPVWFIIRHHLKAQMLRYFREAHTLHCLSVTGFTLNPNLYVSLYRHFASWGYVVIAPSTETGFSPNHTNFALDLAFVLKDMKRRNTLASDIFFGVIDTTVTGVFGHSMGGGCSVLAGSFDTSIAAVASLAAANTNPSSITAANSIKAPQLYLSGQRDSIASYWTQQLPHYNNSYPFKQIVNIKGGNHSYFHLIAGLDDLVDNSATITRQNNSVLREGM